MKIFANAMQFALVFIVASITLEASGQPTAPVWLLVNGVSNPLAIDRDATRFTWRSVDDGRGEMQTAYQILVSSSAEDLAAGKVEWWDSDKVDSDQSASVEYAGTALPPATRFWWKVRIWDQTGKPSPYSAPAHFDTGLGSKRMDGALHLGWNHQPEQLRLFPKDIFDQTKTGPCQGLCHRAQRLSSLFQRTTSGPGAGPLRSILLRAIQRL